MVKEKINDYFNFISERHAIYINKEAGADSGFVRIGVNLMQITLTYPLLWLWLDKSIGQTP